MSSQLRALLEAFLTSPAAVHPPQGVPAGMLPRLAALLTLDDVLLAQEVRLWIRELERRRRPPPGHDRRYARWIRTYLGEELHGAVTRATRRHASVLGAPGPGPCGHDPAVGARARIERAVARLELGEACGEHLLCAPARASLLALETLPDHLLEQELPWWPLQLELRGVDAERALNTVDLLLGAGYHDAAVEHRYHHHIARTLDHHTPQDTVQRAVTQLSDSVGSAALQRLQAIAALEPTALCAALHTWMLSLGPAETLRVRRLCGARLTDLAVYGSVLTRQHAA